jgi:4-hydroxybenzoate polyprenyltransferase
MEPFLSTRKNNIVFLIIEHLKLLRIKDWVKNLFVFIPLFFAGKLFQFQKLESLLLAFISFSLVASSIYIINDYRDIEADKKHPVKNSRPLAAGTVSVSSAFILFPLCCIGGLLIAFSVKLTFFFIVLAYFILNLSYCFGLKDISILDISLIAVGFVLRIKGGGVAASVGVTHWLMIMVFLLALFLAITKRRDDLYLKQTSGVDMRKAIKGYNLELLNILLAIISAIIIIAYIMYTISPDVIRRLGTYRLYYTAIFVIAGLFRYLQITYINKESESPTKALYKDLFLQIVLVLWVISFYVILYIPNLKIFK